MDRYSGIATSLLFWQLLNKNIIAVSILILLFRVFIAAPLNRRDAEFTEVYLECFCCLRDSAVKLLKGSTLS